MVWWVAAVSTWSGRSVDLARKPSIVGDSILSLRLFEMGAPWFGEMGR